MILSELIDDQDLQNQDLQNYDFDGPTIESTSDDQTPNSSEFVTS